MKKALGTNAITLLLLLSISGFLIVFFSNDSFFNWAFEHHQNTLSWFIRPILLLPFCAFAFLRSINGILVSIFAILTSMFWFSVPKNVDPQVADFLAMERERLTAGFDSQNVLSICAVGIFFTLLAMAFWRRSPWLGAGVAALGAILKSIWSFALSPESGQSIVPFAIFGTVILFLGIGITRWVFQRRKNK